MEYRHYGNHKGQILKKAIQTNDGGFMLFGETGYDGLDTLDVHGGHANSSNYGIDLYCVKLDSSLNVEWTKCLGTVKSNVAYDIVQSNDGGYLVLGQIIEVSGDVSNKATQGTNPDLWLVKLDSLGNIEWDRSYGGASDTENQTLIRQDTDGSIILAGVGSATDGIFSGLTNHGGDVFVIKLASFVGLEEKDNPNQHRFVVYPNPVKSQGVLYFGTSGPQSKKCIIRIFDMQGRQLLAREMTIESKTVLQLPALANGMYIYQISSQDRFVENGRFIVQ